MGNINQGTRTQVFDKKQFKLIIAQQQQNLIQQQENYQQKLFSRIPCEQITHKNILIEFICLNEDCRALNRRTCYDCLNQRIHDRDYTFSFQSTRPLNADQLNNLIIYQKGILNQQIYQILYSLCLEQLLLTNENLEETQYLKFKELKRLEEKIEQLKVNIGEININDYIEKQIETNIGIFQYFQWFYNKISYIIAEQNNYLWLKQNAENVIHHFNIKESERIDFCEIKKNKHVIINKIKKTLKYKNKQPEQKEIIFLQQQIKEVGKILHQSGQCQLAVKCFKLLLKYNIQDYDTYLRIGNSYYSLKRFEQSIIEYDNAISLKPKLELAIMQKGNSLNNLSRFQEAIQIYDKAIQLNKVCVMIVGQPDYQIKYKKSIELNNKLYSIIHNNKGITLSNLQKYKEAILMYDQAIKLYPQYPNSYLNKGKSLSYLEKYYEAIQMYDKAIQLNPQFFEAFLNKGICLKNLQNYEKAIKIFDEVIKLNEENSDVYIYKAICLENLQRNQQAIKQYQIASQLNPQYSNDLINLEGFFQKQVHDEAVKLFEESIKLRPQYSDNFVDNEQDYMLIQEYAEAIMENPKAYKFDRETISIIIMSSIARELMV